MGQGKFASQRPTFYHCATTPTVIITVLITGKLRSRFRKRLNTTEYSHEAAKKHNRGKKNQQLGVSSALLQFYFFLPDCLHELLTVPFLLSYSVFVLCFPNFFRFCAVRQIKLAISSAFERTLIYRIVSYRHS